MSNHAIVIESPSHVQVVEASILKLRQPPSTPQMFFMSTTSHHLASAKITVGAFGDDGGIYTTLLPLPAELVASINDKVAAKFTLAYSSVGEAFEFGQPFAANLDDFVFASKLWIPVERQLGEGKIKVHKPSVNEGGPGLSGALKEISLV
ncbi:hypothetical protein QQZ08_007744 [Neonectria magnoliae]|uniref:Uncharacterized protein n=1 Tax=Neonectria magnoliae TaxID=2732573 RepID=A0ABR1HWW7_9HYPO